MKILYKVLAPLFGILSLVGMYFLPIFRVTISSSLSETLMSSVGLREFYSINYLVKFATSKDTSNQILKTVLESFNDPDSKIGAMFTNKGWVIAAIVFLALAVVTCVVMMVFAVASKRPVIGTCLSGGVIAFALSANACFNAFAKPFLTGQIGLSSLLTGGDTTDKTVSTLSSLLGSVVSVSYLKLSYAYSAMLFLMVLLVIIGVCACFEKSFSK